jgi:hypothetical protein
MTKTHSSIATDSEEDLRQVIGEDSTATFESDPNFIASDPAANASTESVVVQRDTDDTEDSEEELEESDLDEEDSEEEHEEEAETDLVVDEGLRM